MLNSCYNVDEEISAGRMFMKLQRLLSLTRQAIDAYDMIEEGDRIAVGISGGKGFVDTFICAADVK